VTEHSQAGDVVFTDGATKGRLPSVAPGVGHAPLPALRIATVLDRNTSPSSAGT
jgi:hypothetical protein